MQDYTSSVRLENAIAMQKYGVGQPVRRKEDDTLVRGKGKYTDDFNLPRQTYAWIVRSSHAHGIIRGIDTKAAKAMPGVLGIWTGTDLAAAGYGPFTCGLPLKSRDGTPRFLIRSAQILSAASARSMAALSSRPVWVKPSPSLTILENASSTRKPRGVGAAISRRQLLVPRSSAA